MKNHTSNMLILNSQHGFKRWEDFFFAARLHNLSFEALHLYHVSWILSAPSLSEKPKCSTSAYFVKRANPYSMNSLSLMHLLAKHLNFKMCYQPCMNETKRGTIGNKGSMCWGKRLCLKSTHMQLLESPLNLIFGKTKRKSWFITSHKAFQKAEKLNE